MAGVEGEHQIVGVDVGTQFRHDSDDAAVRRVVEVEVVITALGIIVAVADVGVVVVVGGETIPAGDVGAL